jgi:hypothetical protein
VALAVWQASSLPVALPLPLAEWQCPPESALLANRRNFLKVPVTELALHWQWQLPLPGGGPEWGSELRSSTHWHLPLAELWQCQQWQ